MPIKETAFKASGYYGRYKSILQIIFGIILFVLGIVVSFYIFIIENSVYGFYFLIVSLFGVLMIISGWLLWKRTKSLVQGKFM